MPANLTRAQYDELQQQFNRLPDLATSYEVTGEHYMLIHMLNRLGYYPGDRREAIEIAEGLLSHDYTPTP
jgi:hypothetical protein